MPCSEACLLWAGLLPPWLQQPSGQVPRSASRRPPHRARKSCKVRLSGPGACAAREIPALGQSARAQLRLAGWQPRFPCAGQSQVWNCCGVCERPRLFLLPPGEYENRLRRFANPEKLFEYFASVEDPVSRVALASGRARRLRRWAFRTAPLLARMSATRLSQDSGEPLMVPEDMVRALVPYNRLLGGRVGSPNPKFRFAARKEKSSPVSAARGAQLSADVGGRRPSRQARAMLGVTAASAVLQSGSCRRRVGSNEPASASSALSLAAAIPFSPPSIAGGPGPVHGRRRGGGRIRINGRTGFDPRSVGCRPQPASRPGDGHRRQRHAPCRPARGWNLARSSH